MASCSMGKKDEVQDSDLIFFWNIETLSTFLSNTESSIQSNFSQTKGLLPWDNIEKKKREKQKYVWFYVQQKTPS